MNTTIKDLPCVLTEAELVDKLKEVNALTRKGWVLEEEKAADAAKFATRIKVNKLDVRMANRAYETGIEDRPVVCQEEKDFRRWEVQTVRTDTGEVIGKRAMSEAERQEELPLQRIDDAPEVETADTEPPPESEDVVKPKRRAKGPLARKNAATKGETS